MSAVPKREMPSSSSPFVSLRRCSHGSASSLQSSPNPTKPSSTSFSSAPPAADAGIRNVCTHSIRNFFADMLPCRVIHNENSRPAQRMNQSNSSAPGFSALSNRNNIAFKIPPNFMKIKAEPNSNRNRNRTARRFTGHWSQITIRGFAFRQSPLTAHQSHPSPKEPRP